MATLRATQFGSGLISGTSVINIYTVPTGKKAIVKNLVLTNVSASSCDVNVRVGAFGTWFTQHLAAYGFAGASVSLSLWAVFNAGDVLQLQRGNAGQITFIMGGSLMTV